jgi:hypothetical protein
MPFVYSIYGIIQAIFSFHVLTGISFKSVGYSLKFLGYGAVKVVTIGNCYVY